MSLYILERAWAEITELCGTPAFVKKDSGDIPSTTTLILRVVRKLSIHLRSVGRKPKVGILTGRFYSGGFFPVIV